jgi:hypothetical protein
MLANAGGKPPPRFRVSNDEFYFQAIHKSGEASYLSKFTIDRYTSFAHELQTVSVPDKLPYMISGEYRCKRIDKPAF